MKSYLTADSLYKKIDAPLYEIKNYILLGNLFNKIKEFDNALEYLNKALRLSEQKSLLNEKATVMNHIGYMYFKKEI